VRGRLLDAGIRLLHVDGRRCDPAEAVLPATLPGVLRGDGIFEAFVAVDGEPAPGFEEHASRLQRSAVLTGLDLEGRGLAEEFPAFQRLLAREAPGAWRVRYTVLRGLEGTVRLWTAGPLPPPPPEVDLHWSRFRRDPGDPLCGAKTVSRVQAEAARREAEAAGAWDALLPTVEGDLAECTAANVFFWREGRLETPAPDRGILEGVTRKAVLRTCREAGIPVREGRILPSEAREAEEMFLTNAVQGLLPVRRLLGIREDYPGAAGPVFRRLRPLLEAIHLPPS